MKRILAMVLVMMMILAMPAMAEMGKLTTVTISNVEISMGTEKSFPLGYSLEMSGGAKNETDGMLNIKFNGADSNIANVTAAMENGLIKVSMDGLTNNYSITEEDLKDQMNQAQADLGAYTAVTTPDGVRTEAGISPEALQGLIDSYMKAIEEAAANEQKEMPADEAYEMMGLTKGDAEDVIIHEKTMNLPKYQGTLKAADFDRIMSKSYEMMPSMKEFMEKYMDIMQQAAAASGEDINFTMDNMFENMFAQTGMDITVELTVWADDPANNMRMEMNEIITVPAAEEGAEPETVNVPFVMEISTDEEGQLVTGGMTMGVDDSNALISFEFTDKQPETGAETFGFVLIDVDDVQVKASFDVSYNAEGAGHFDIALTGPTGEAFTMNIQSTDGTHHVAMGAVGLNPGMDIMNDFAVSFDVTTSEAELPEALFDEQGKPMVSIMEMTDDDMQLIQQEAQREGIIMFGKIMSDRGLSEMVSYFTAFAQQEFETSMETQVEEVGDETPVEEAAA